MATAVQQSRVVRPVVLTRVNAGFGASLAARRTTEINIYAAAVDGRSGARAALNLTA
jgi:hypothetical protein